MAKDKKWLRKEVYKLFPSHDEMYIHPDDITIAKTELLHSVDELIVQLDEPDEPKVLPQKPPVLPKFVGDFLDGKEGYFLCDLLDDIFYKDENDKIAEWIYGNDKETNKQRERSFLLACAYGYDVEENEPKFYVYLGDGQYLVSEDELTKPHARIRHEEDNGFLNYNMLFTEQEIKDFDPRYWLFKEPVEEPQE